MSKHPKIPKSSAANGSMMRLAHADINTPLYVSTVMYIEDCLAEFVHVDPVAKALHCYGTDNSATQTEQSIEVS